MLDLLVLTVVQAVVMVVALTAVSLFSLRAMKAVCIVLLIANSIALYFINTYHVILDKGMMGNVFATDSEQTLELFHPRLIAYLIFFGLLPACCGRARGRT